MSMSSSVTTTISVTQELAPLSYTLKMTGVESVKKQISALVGEMLSSNAFSPQFQTFIKVWESNYFEKHLKSLSEQPNRLKASRGICVLLYDIIYPTLKNEKDSVKKRSVQKIEEDFIQILESILPEGKTLEVFLEEYENGLQKEKLFHAKIVSMHVEMQKGGDLLNSFAEETEDNFIQQFEILKNKMIKLNSTRRQLTEEMNKKLDALTEKVGALGVSLQSAGAEVDKTTEKVHVQQQKFLSILSDCQTLLQEI